MESVLGKWRPVVGFEGKYEVSDIGMVRSLDRRIPFKCRWGHIVMRRHAGRLLGLERNTSGYFYVRLGKRLLPSLIHGLVAAAFIGRRPAGMQVNHKDGNKLNNCVENLEYVTTQENIAHARRMGLLDIRGEKNIHATLTDAQTIEISTRLDAGESIADLSKEFHVSRGVIEKVKRRETYAHLPLKNIPKRRHLRLSCEQRSRILSLAEGGMPQAEICRATTLPQTTVSRIMRGA